MTNAVSELKSAATSTAHLVPWLRSLRDALRNENGRWILRDAIPEQRRQALTHLRSSLSARLSGSQAEKAHAVEVAKLLAAFPIQASGETAKELAMEQYMVALDGLPAWAVSEARERFVNGSFGPRRFAPSPAELASSARQRMRGAQDDLALVTRILDAEVDATRNPDEYQRVRAGFENLADELRGRVNGKRGHDNPVADLAALAERMGVDLDSVPDARPSQTWRKAG